MSGLHMKYFVLKPDGADDYAYASRAALWSFAEEIESSNPDLAADLYQWVIDIRENQ